MTQTTWKLLEKGLEVSPGKIIEYAEVLHDLERLKQISPIDFHDAYGIQKDIEDCDDLSQLICGGNRSGKTEIVVKKVLRKCLDKPKQKWWIVGETFQDSIAIQQSKVWALVPKHKLKYGNYDEIHGFTNRKILFRNGSLIIFKCLTRGNRINMADGTWRPIEHVDVGEYVFDVNGLKRKVINKFCYGRTKVFNIITKGHTVQCTPEHRFFVIGSGWKEIKDIKKGDVLETCAYGGNDWVARWKPAILALLIAEGCLVTERSPDFTTTSKKLLEYVASVLPEDFKIKEVSKKHQPFGYRLSSKHMVDNRIKKFLMDSNLWGKKADSKHIPEFVFKWNETARKEFIEILYACDGRITRLDSVYTTSSKKLAYDLQRLLWSFSIHPFVRKVNERHYRVECCANQRRRFDIFNVIDKNETYRSKQKKRFLKEGTVLSKLAHDKTKDVFCLEVEGSHEFIVEGLRTHNSYDQQRESFQGDQIDGVLFDEEVPYEIYQECRMRLIDRNGQMLLSMTSLKGVTELIQNLYEDCDVTETKYAPLIGEELPRKAVKDKIRIFFLWSTENPHIPQERVEEEAKLLTRDEIKSRIYGLPINLTGRIYGSFSKDIHVIDIEDMPDGKYTLYHVLDPHDRKPWAMIWMAVHKTGSVYVVDEYPNRDFNDMTYDDKTYGDYATEIRRKEADLKDMFRCDVRRRIIDPNFGNKTVQLAKRQGGQSSTTPKRELQKLGFNFMDGIDAIAAGHLKVRESLHYVCSNDGEIVVQPKLRFVDTCRNCIKHMSRYSHKAIETASGDVKDKVAPEDKYKDFPDCVRYGMMSNLVYSDGYVEPEYKRVY